MDTTQESNSQLSLGDGEVDLGKLTVLIKRRDTIETKIKAAQDLLKGLTDDRNRVSQIEIPELMDEYGVGEIKLVDGRRIKVKNILKASINKDNRETAYEWLKEQGHADIIKAQVTFKTTKGREDDAKAVLEAIKKLGFSADLTNAVHWQTLNAWAREQSERGMEFPEFIGIFEMRETEVK